MIDHLLSLGFLRRKVWQFWYPYLTRRLRRDDVLFLNYAFEESPSRTLELSPTDEPDRGCVQLYHHVASQTELRDKQVLEVSCGHGGGASYLTRTFEPSTYTGLDLNRAGIEFCRQRHHLAGLAFVQGDAEELPFAGASFDVVINVEASHCYRSLPRFLGEVARVLRPGGTFVYADFRFASGLAEWESNLQLAPFRLRQSRVITQEVRRGMERNSSRSALLIERHLPGFLHSLGRDFAGVTGSRIHQALVQGQLSYRSFCFETPAVLKPL